MYQNYESYVYMPYNCSIHFKMNHEKEKNEYSYNTGNTDRSLKFLFANITSVSYHFGSKINIKKDIVTEEYQPKTELVKYLLKLRSDYIRKGGKLLSPEQLENELILRRGGIGYEKTNIP